MTPKGVTRLTISFAGKTYSLFGAEPMTENYYRKVSSLAERVLEGSPDILGLIRTLERASRKKRFLKKQLSLPYTSRTAKRRIAFSADCRSGPGELDANRCMRWVGAFHPTSVDLDALSKLVGDSSKRNTKSGLRI